MRDQDRQRPTTGNASDVSADDLFRRIVEIINDARGRVTRTVNSAMVQAYWEIGRQIVEVEQQGDPRAGYGEQVLAGLSERLTRCFGRGFSQPNLKRMRCFFLAYSVSPAIAAADNDKRDQQIGSTLSSQLATIVQPLFRQELGWSHYVLLMAVPAPLPRSFYETEAAREGWSCRELERQIASHLHERLTASRDKDDILALAHQGQDVSTPQDVVKDPLVLEFLGLSDRPHWRERDLEQAIIDQLQEFMLELGKGFSFVARQKRITLDGDHFFVDLVFYNRLLRCFVLIDLKLGKLTHRDLGQLQMYVNWYDRTQLEAAVQEGRRAAERQGPSGCGPAS
jgi:predicted nuclease of restriction endonuclease-like (RecB) superfamily